MEGRFVFVLGLDQARCRRSVKSLEDTLEDGRLIGAGPSRERSSHDNDLHLGSGMPNGLQGLDPVLGDRASIVVELGAAKSRGLFSGVTLRAIIFQPAGTVRAPAVRAAGRCRHHGHDGHARERPRGLAANHRLVAGTFFRFEPIDPVDVGRQRSRMSLAHPLKLRAVDALRI
jgi:hypothetical protein